MSAISTTFQGFNSYTPVLPSGAAAPYTSASEGGSSDEGSKSSSKMLIGGLDSSMIKLLMDEGLTSDVTAFFLEMSGVINRAYDPVTGRYNLNAYKLLIPKLTRIKNEKELFKKALDKSYSNEAMDEIAISSKGLVFVADPEQGIITKSAQEITSEDRTLTNGELAQMRLNYPGAAWRTEFTDALSNGVGTLKITEYLLNSISKLGKSEVSSELFANASGEVISGLLALLQMITGNKGFVQVTTDQASLLEQIKYALGYLANTLPSNMATVLRVRALQSGVTVVDLMHSLILSTASSKFDQKTNFKGAGTGDGSLADDSSKTKLTPAAALYTGRVPVMSNFQLSYGTANTYTGEALISNLVDVNNNNLLAGSLLTAFYPGDMKRMFDTSNIVMGNVKIDNPNMIRIKDSSMAVIELPIDIEAAEEGIIRPNLNMLTRKDEADRRIRDEHASTPEEINKIYRDCKLPPKYDSNGEEITLNYIRFAVIKGYIDEDTMEKQARIEDEEWDTYLLEVKNDATNSWLKSLYKADKIEVGDLYEGNIYIPMITNNGIYRNAAMGAFNNLSVGLSTTILREDASLNASKAYQYRPAGSISQYKNQ